MTQAAVLPGQEFVYRFRADQAGTYWYHTHSVSDVRAYGWASTVSWWCTRRQ